MSLSGTTSPTETLAVVDLADLRYSDASLAGAKAATLGELMWLGFPVPAARVIMVNAFREFVDRRAVRLALREALRDLDTASAAQLTKIAQAAAEIMAQAPAPSWAADVMKWAGSAGCPMAIRSSATCEDLPDATFAGQYDSYLNVAPRDVMSHIVKCFASLYNARAVLYRRRKGIASAGQMAAIAQKMVRADAAGVVYTRSPRDRNHLLIEAAAGLGEGVVSGTVAPNRYAVERGTLSLRESRATNPVLDLDVRNIALEALKVERALGFAVDLEFAVESGRFHILQARPVATRPAS